MTINANNPTVTNVKYRWWEESEGTVAGAMASAAGAIEKYGWPRRWLNLTCTRYMTGREMSSLYAYSMAKRPASLSRAYAAAEWRPPTDNVIATCADVFSARIWKQRPFIIVVPYAGNFKARVKAKKLARFCDAVFAEAKFWDTYELNGIDAMTTGDAFVKVHESLSDKGKIAITRVLADEILVNEEEALYGQPRSLLQRCFIHREELISKYGTTPALRDSIWKAPGAYPGLYFGGDLNAQDVVPFVEGWHLAGWNSQTDKEEEGRTVVAIGDVMLDDRKWTKNRFPFAHLQFKQLTTGYFGQGLAEQLLSYQAELNRYDEADWENQRRISWPRVLNPIGSMASKAALSGVSGGVIDHAPNMEPKFIFPEATSPLAEARRERIKRSAYRRAGISETAAAGEKPGGLNSGAAIMAWATVDDSRHVDLGQRGEDYVTDVANLVFDLAEEIKPKVRLPGRTVQEIAWDDVRMANNLYAARAFPMSRLPQLPAARQQTIANWYADGQIDKATKMRLEQVPDTEGYADIATAARDDIEMVLDAIVEEGDYLPPEPFEDLKAALSIAQSRYLQERARGCPEDRLDLLLHWIMQCDEQLAEGAGVVGIQPPAVNPAAPPPQTTPSQGPPAQLQAA